MEIKSISIAVIFVVIMTILGPSIIGVGEMSDNKDDNDSGWIKKLLKDNNKSIQEKILKDEKKSIQEKIVKDDNKKDDNKSISEKIFDLLDFNKLKGFMKNIVSPASNNNDDHENDDEHEKDSDNEKKKDTNSEKKNDFDFNNLFGFMNSGDSNSENVNSEDVSSEDFNSEGFNSEGLNSINTGNTKAKIHFKGVDSGSITGTSNAKNISCSTTLLEFDIYNIKDGSANPVTLTAFYTTTPGTPSDINNINTLLTPSAMTYHTHDTTPPTTGATFNDNTAAFVVGGQTSDPNVPLSGATNPSNATPDKPHSYVGLTIAQPSGTTWIRVHGVGTNGGVSNAAFKVTNPESCNPPPNEMIEHAFIDLGLSKVLVDPNEEPNTGDEYFDNLITECSFHTDESIANSVCIICKLVDKKIEPCNDLFLGLTEFVHGTILNTQIDGVTVSADAFDGRPDKVIIFDGDTPGGSTDTASQPDPDLRADGNQGDPNLLDGICPKCAGLHIAIIPENDNGGGDGIVDKPNDSAKGGIQTWVFDKEWFVRSFDFVDYDNAAINGKARAYDNPECSGTPVATADIKKSPNGGDGSVQTILLNANNVRCLQFEYKDSGGVTNIKLECIKKFDNSGVLSEGIIELPDGYEASTPLSIPLEHGVDVQKPVGVKIELVPFIAKEEEHEHTDGTSTIVTNDGDGEDIGTADEADDGDASGGQDPEDDGDASGGQDSGDDGDASGGQDSEGSGKVCGCVINKEDNGDTSGGQDSEDDGVTSGGQDSEDDGVTSGGQDSEDDCNASGGQDSEDDGVTSGGQDSEDDGVASGGQDPEDGGDGSGKE